MDSTSIFNKLDNFGICYLVFIFIYLIILDRYPSFIGTVVLIILLSALVLMILIVMFYKRKHKLKDPIKNDDDITKM
jgi:hypothetical protein